ncbi:hypothetical protein FGG78_12095 [Thioclava sp. BHET1]|uniref:Uncharacterized protein n=1 Tax=Thioclava dalianensis TaxID=1185766 RepID=A0A074U9U1_9RHOB|nr:hypothetical protein [Thioclava dalianensis]KEP71457.1 hypothetical protein DL1_07200 [Thioclava dalianensis]TMV90864.1 hypothetical protein FGG78_12095 [Thioclava sp. BHET1]SFM78493.1 hypothetical protein SAMN05216224_101286 [Thioclava dalianensis]
MTKTKENLDLFATSATKRPANLHDKTAAAARQITDDAKSERDAQSARLKARRIARDTGQPVPDDGAANDETDPQ